MSTLVEDSRKVLWSDCPISNSPCQYIIRFCWNNPSRKFVVGGRITFERLLYLLKVVRSSLLINTNSNWYGLVSRKGLGLVPRNCLSYPLICPLQRNLLFNLEWTPKINFPSTLSTSTHIRTWKQYIRGTKSKQAPHALMKQSLKKAQDLSWSRVMFLDLVSSPQYWSNLKSNF